MQGWPSEGRRCVESTVLFGDDDCHLGLSAFPFGQDLAALGGIAGVLQLGVLS